MDNLLFRATYPLNFHHSHQFDLDANLLFHRHRVRISRSFQHTEGSLTVGVGTVSEVEPGNSAGPLP